MLTDSLVELSIFLGILGVQSEWSAGTDWLVDLNMTPVSELLAEDVTPLLFNPCFNMCYQLYLSKFSIPFSARILQTMHKPTNFDVSAMLNEIDLSAIPKPKAGWLNNHTFRLKSICLQWEIR